MAKHRIIQNKGTHLNGEKYTHYHVQYKSWRKWYSYKRNNLHTTQEDAQKFMDSVTTEPVIKVVG